MRKRFFAVFVSLCMIVSMLPANAFAQGDVPSIVTGADGLCEHHTRHDKSCGYGENSPCGYVCGLCGAAAAPAACTCETLCAEGAADGGCPVCAAAGADLSACQGAAPAAALAASPLLNARNGGEEIVVGEVTLTATSESPAYATTDDTGKVTEGGSESSYNIKWDGATLTLNGANIAGGASFSFAAQQSTAAIYREGDLDIVLVGESTAAGSEAYGSSFGVFVENGALSIQGGAGLPPQAARAPTAAASPLKRAGFRSPGAP